MKRKWDIKATHGDAPLTELLSVPRMECTTAFADIAKAAKKARLPTFEIKRLNGLGICLLVGPNFQHILKTFHSENDLLDWLWNEDRK